MPVCDVRSPCQRKLVLICLKYGTWAKTWVWEKASGAGRKFETALGVICKQTGFLCQVTAHFPRHRGKVISSLQRSDLPGVGCGGRWALRSRRPCALPPEAACRLLGAAVEPLPSLAPCRGGGRKQRLPSTLLRATASLLHFLENSLAAQPSAQQIQDPLHFDLTMTLPWQTSAWEPPPSLFPIKGRQSGQRSRG